MTGHDGAQHLAAVRKRSWTTKAGTSTAWLVDYRDGQGKRRFMSFDTKKEAQAALADVTVEVKRGVHTPAAASITVAQAAEIWIERGEPEGWNEARCGITAIISTNSFCQSSAARSWPGSTTPMIQTNRDGLVGDRSRSQAAKILTSFKGILGEAQRRGLVAQNVAQPVKVEHQEARAAQAGDRRRHPLESRDQQADRGRRGALAAALHHRHLHRHAGLRIAWPALG